MEQLYNLLPIKDPEEIATEFLTLPKVLNPYSGNCKVILFSIKKEELFIALLSKINLTPHQLGSQEEYIDFSKFVQATKEYMLASGFRGDIRKEFDLIHYKKMKDNPLLDNQLARLNISWYPLEVAKKFVSPIELSFIKRMNEPVTFSI